MGLERQSKWKVQIKNRKRSHSDNSIKNERPYLRELYIKVSNGKQDVKKKMLVS